MTTKTAAGWKQAAELKESGDSAFDELGDSVAVSGATTIVGAPDSGNYDAERAYLFRA